MELKTFILGTVPASLTIIAALARPVSSKTIEEQSFELSEQFVSETVSGNKRDVEKNAIARVMTAVAIGTAEASGLVRTWISSLTSLTAIFIEIIDPMWCLGMVLIIMAVTAILGLAFFTNLNFYRFSTVALRRGFCRGYTGVKCTSRILILINLIMITITAVIWLWTNSYVASVLDYMLTVHNAFK